MPIEIFWGLGTLVLLAALVLGVVYYRSSRAGREQADIERRSRRQNPKD
jgi:hypothetical protein